METLIVRRKSDLSKLKTSDEIYYQDSKDYTKDGEAIDTFSKNSQSVIGTMSNLTPHWDYTKNEWSFYGGFQSLLEIAKKLQLRGQNNELLLPTEYSLKNPNDPFFAHKSLWQSTFMEEGSKYLTEETPLEEFYMRVLKGREDIEQPDREPGEQSAFLTSGSKLEILSPRAELKVQSNKIDEEVEAILLYDSLRKNFDKMKRIVSIADPPSYDESYNDPVAMAALLKHELVDNTQYVTKYGMEARKYFMHLCNLPNEDLEVYSKVLRAAQDGIIRRNSKSGYTMKGELLAEGSIRDDKKLVEFFQKDENISYYSKLEDLIANK
jgi:hypothetical protein